MKLSVVLWKCCQEQQSKIENLESKLFETMARVEALEKTKPKAKAKSKAKAENNYINKYLNRYIIPNFKGIHVMIPFFCGI